MTRAIDTSLTLVGATDTAPIDAHTFANPSRYVSIRSQSFGRALEAVAKSEARRRRVVVGGGDRGTEVEFYVLDLRHDRVLKRQVARLLNDAFIDAASGALKAAVRDEGLLAPEATDKLAAIENLIELRRFIANAATPQARRKDDLLFHYTVAEAGE